MNALKICQVSPEDADLHVLIAELDRVLLVHYAREYIFAVDFSDAKVRAMTFCVAYLDGRPAGCGALRPLDGEVAELKRFFVSPAFRRRGVASAVLGFLEGEARRQGFSRIKLETGWKLPEAIALYKRFGYQDAAPYGEYIGSVQSYCMEKELF